MAPHNSASRSLQAPLGLACLHGICGAWAIVAVEGLVVLGRARREITSLWELNRGLVYLVPLTLPVAALVGAAGSWFLATLALSPMQGGARRWLTLAITMGLGIAAWSVGGGRHLASVTTRFEFASLVGLVAGALAYWLGPRWSIWARTRRFAARLAALILLVGFELTNRFVLVRLYPGFHTTLGLATLLLAALPCWNWDAPHLGRYSAAANPKKKRAVWPLLTVITGCVALLLLSPAAAQGLRRFDNFRLILVERAPLLGQVVGLGARLAPPEPIACSAGNWDSACAGMPADSTPVSASFSLQGRDILLITVDALRADHLGAYGYQRPTSPNIDRIAAQAVRFNHAYSPTAHTSYSVTSMMTGKYMRPLLLQGAGADSETFATFLRRYGYRTAAFYPPAVFFIDPQRFEHFRDSYLGFEFRKVEFLEGPARVEQVARYLDTVPNGHRLFVWVHLFGPHEPYEAHAGYDFGTRDVDRYDSEIAYADAAIGQLSQVFLAKRPGAMVVLSADHGEEFGDHGGRYHGSTVFEEQVRVPLVIYAPNLFGPGVVDEPVQTIDLLPTVLAALDVPRPARVRGRNLAPLLVAHAVGESGLAMAETEEQVMLAEGQYRLICARQVGACRLFDILADPGEKSDLQASERERVEHMRRRMQDLSASHGQYEAQGLRAEGRGWPNAILRGVAGDGDAAEEIASLLDDADSVIRRKAAELLFELNRPMVGATLRLALTRDEDPDVRAWCALALTRMGQGAPLVFDLLNGHDGQFARLAALALADAGDPRGVEQLVGWWRDAAVRNYQQSRWLLTAFGRLRAKAAVPYLVRSLGDVRLRPHIAEVLAAIGDTNAREPLAKAFGEERYQNSRVAIAKALVQLHAREEIARPLLRFLGVPDPIPGGLGFALQSKVLQYVGGPEPKELEYLTRTATLGTRVRLVIPRGSDAQFKGSRLIVRVSNEGSNRGEVRVLPVRETSMPSSNSQALALRNFNISRQAPLLIVVPENAASAELHQPVPKEFGWVERHAIELDVLATSGVRVEAMAVVPLADELPPPPPQPWVPVDEPNKLADGSE